MAKFTQIQRDAQLERTLSRVLKMGVLLATTVVSIGGVFYLLRHGMDTLNDDIFQSAPDNLQMSGAKDTPSLPQRSLIQFGLLILLMTPILRVASSVYAFAKQRDRIYLMITSVVLAVLLFSLFNPVT